MQGIEVLDGLNHDACRPLYMFSHGWPLLDGTHAPRQKYRLAHQHGFIGGSCRLLVCMCRLAQVHTVSRFQLATWLDKGKLKLGRISDTPSSVNSVFTQTRRKGQEARGKVHHIDPLAEELPGHCQAACFLFIFLYFTTFNFFYFQIKGLFMTSSPWLLYFRFVDMQLVRRTVGMLY